MNPGQPTQPLCWMLSRRLEVNRRNTEPLIFSQTSSTHSHPRGRPTKLESSSTHLSLTQPSSPSTNPVASILKKREKVQNPALFTPPLFPRGQTPPLSPGFCVFFDSPLASTQAHLQPFHSTAIRRIVFRSLPSAQSPVLTSVSE